MRILGSYIIPLFIISIVFHPSCTPGGALTPEDAFFQIQAACRYGDVNRLALFISTKSKKNIKIMLTLFSKMEESQLQKIAKVYHIPVRKMQKMTVEDYLRFSLDTTKSNNHLLVATRYKITSIKKEENRALIRVANGMFLHFIKEGPYWMLCIDNLIPST